MSNELTPDEKDARDQKFIDLRNRELDINARNYEIQTRITAVQAIMQLAQYDKTFSTNTTTIIEKASKLANFMITGQESKISTPGR